MKPKELFKDIFNLAMKLSGLFFLYLAFRDVPPLLQLLTMAGYTKTDIISAALPVAFNLAVCWWLIGNKFLIRRAYPEKSNSSDRGLAHLSTGPAEPPSMVPQSPEPSGVDAAEKRLASLLKKPDDSTPG